MKRALRFTSVGLAAAAGHLSIGGWSVYLASMRPARCQRYVRRGAVCVDCGKVHRSPARNRKAKR